MSLCVSLFVSLFVSPQQQNFVTFTCWHFLKSFFVFFLKSHSSLTSDLSVWQLMGVSSLSPLILLPSLMLDRMSSWRQGKQMITSRSERRWGSEQQSGDRRRTCEDRQVGLCRHTSPWQRQVSCLQSFKQTNKDALTETCCRTLVSRTYSGPCGSVWDVSVCRLTPDRLHWSVTDIKADLGHWDDLKHGLEIVSFLIGQWVTCVFAENAAFVFLLPRLLVQSMNHVLFHFTSLIHSKS